MNRRLEAKGVTARYSSVGESVLDSIDLVVDEGEFVMLLGPSGCGKSTLLNIIAGLVTPLSGEVFVDNKLVRGAGPDRTVVFQDGALFPWLTVGGNVEFGLREARIPLPQRRSTAEAMLRQVGLEGQFNRPIHELSGGMKQRVAIARALVLKPLVLLMDEPFSALDAITREDLYAVMQGMSHEPAPTVLFVTHNVREAVTLGDRVLVMAAKPGRIAGEFKIELPRPRHIDDQNVSALAREISQMLRSTMQ